MAWNSDLQFARYMLDETVHFQAGLVQEAGQGMGCSINAAPKKQHVPPLISTLLREMLSAAQTDQVSESQGNPQKPSNRKLFSAQGFSGAPQGMIPTQEQHLAPRPQFTFLVAVLAGQNPKLRKPPNKGAVTGKRTAAGISKGSKASTVTKGAKGTAVKRKPDAVSKPRTTTARGTASHDETGTGSKSQPDTGTLVGPSATTAGATTNPANGMPKADTASKRRKVSDISVEESTAKVKAAMAAGKLTSLSVPELKVYLKSIGKPVGGKKSDLLERIQSSHEP